MRICCGVASSPPIGSRPPFPIVVPVFSVVDSSRLIVTGCFLRPSSSSPLEYMLRSPSPLGVMVFFPYSCYSVTSIRTFMHTAACRNRVYLSHPRLSTSLPGRPQYPPRILSLSALPSDNFFFVYNVVVFTLITLAFSHRFQYCRLSSLSFPSCRLFGSPLLLPLVFI